MLKLNVKNSLQSSLKSGISAADLALVSDKLASVRATYLAQKPDLGFTRLPEELETMQYDLQLAKAMAKDMEAIVIIGIGGSDLGARAFHRALNSQYHNESIEKDKREINPDSLISAMLKAEAKVYFAGDTTDPSAILQLVEVLNLSKTLFIIISKSGNTIEQASSFIYFRNLVVTTLGQEAAKQHFLFLTDPSTGTLRDLANKLGYKAISVPSDVGGRFSVLSSVGMVPAHLIGLNVAEFLRGAADLQKAHEAEASNDMIAEYVAVQYQHYLAGKDLSVMMPYNYNLWEFAKWYQQLWAESLGKKLDNQGKLVNTGMTPIAALGPVDQHSQLQLYTEGPNDKFFTFIISEQPVKDLQLPQNYQGVEAFDYLKGKTFADILALEHSTTAFSLAENDRPNVTIQVPVLDEYHLGQLFYFFEVAVSYMGILFDVNTYDQPGVELSKNAMFGALGKSGYDKEKQAYEKYLKI